jgi:hypothetical protein
MATQINFQGTLLQCFTGSPGARATIANVSSVTYPLSEKTQDTTSAADTIGRTVPTLLMAGPVTCKVFWDSTEATQSASAGLRFLLKNQLLRQWFIVYPNTGQPADSFYGYVTKFNLTGKVAGVYEADVEISINDQSIVLQ